MTETTKIIFEKYEVRKTKVQKAKFAEFAQEVAKKNSYAFRIEEGKGSRPKNIVIGDPDSAKVIFTAHYDTCAALPFPNLITPKNILLYILCQAVITAAMVFAAGVLAVATGELLRVIGVSADVISNIDGWIVMAFALMFYFLMMKGPANKHTANDNTSGVTLLFDIMQSLPEELRDKAAFVFFDLEEVGLVGSSAFYAKHKEKMKDKLLINFDCVSEGNHILLILKKKALCYKELLSDSFKANEKYTVHVEWKNVIYPSDQAKFPHGVGVASLKKSKKLGILYMDRIHTKKDIVYDEENISFLADGAIKLCQSI